MDEPSVLDYLKAKLMPWRGPAPEIPTPQPDRATFADTGSPPPMSAVAQADILAQSGAGAAAQERSTPAVQALSIPWLTLLSFTLAFLAQASLEPGPDRSWTLGAALYLISTIGMVAASWRGEWVPAALPEMQIRKDPLTLNLYGFLAALLVSVPAYYLFGGNRFTTLNVILWLLSVLLIAWAFWLPDPQAIPWWQKLRTAITQREWKLTITWSTVVAVAAAALILFFRLYRLDQVPPEMFSDHAEKLLDVWDVLHGETSIFFIRNTGREALQMYMTAGVIQLFNTGYSHLSLKIGTALAGLLTLPFIYLLGKEMGSRRIGLLAAVLAGVAYWPNVISRVGLRFPLYPLFVAPTLYFLLRGIRRSNRNDFIISGVFLGIGLHGYTPIRILPVVIVIAIGIFLLHRQSKSVRRQTLVFLGILALVCLVVFLPLLRYAVENPEGFAFRSFSRLGTVERPLPGPAAQIFMKNLWEALTMFAWDNGDIWVVSVTHRPAMDVVTGALFFAGVVLLIVRYVRSRHWLDLFILLSVPLLMLPSILSLAYPGENPALNRLSGALVPMFLIAAIALDGLMTALSSRLGGTLGPKVAWGFGMVCILLASVQNYGLVFDEYQRMFVMSSWNTSEMGEVINQFADTVGTPDTAWVLAYPHWVDTRLVGMNAGFPLKDYAIWPEQLADTAADPRAKLFLVKPEDSEGLNALQMLYPQGVLNEYNSRVDFHNFLMYFIPPQQ
jgi:4-amino-4-deoxy-L-arabinose transferase-like glycosyltransferase